jgi:hypothetical protein
MKLLSLFAALVFALPLYSMNQKPNTERFFANSDIVKCITTHVIGRELTAKEAVAVESAHKKSDNRCVDIIKEYEYVEKMTCKFPGITRYNYTLSEKVGLPTFKGGIKALNTIHKRTPIDSVEFQQLLQCKAANPEFFKSAKVNFPKESKVVMSQRERYFKFFKAIAPTTAKKILVGGLSGTILVGGLLAREASSNQSPLSAKDSLAVLGTGAVCGGLIGGVHNLCFGDGIELYLRDLRQPQELKTVKWEDFK